MKLFDLHCDTLTRCFESNESLLSNPFHWDIQRGLGLFDRFTQIMAIYVRDGLAEDDAWRYVTQALSFLNTQAALCDRLCVVRSAHDLECDGQVARCNVLPAVENGAAIGSDLSRIELLSQCGVVYITVTWNGSNLLGNGCLSSCHDGLTPLGKAAVREMHRVHILPDVSHLNEAGFWDVVSLSDGKPFLATHSVSDAIHHHPRSLTDEQFKAICSAEGLVGLNLCEAQLGEQSFDRLERHLSHFLAIGGEKVLALGLDLDGTDLPSSWNGIEVAARLFDYLLKKGYREAVLNRIFFENSQTFFMKTLTSKEECIRIGT